MFNKIKTFLVSWWNAKSLTWKIIDCVEAFFVLMGIIKTFQMVL